MSVKLLTEHLLEVLSLKGGCTGWSESTLVKIPHCWKSHVTVQMLSTDNTIAHMLYGRITMYMNGDGTDW